MLTSSQETKLKSIVKRLLGFAYASTLTDEDIRFMAKNEAFLEDWLDDN